MAHRTHLVALIAAVLLAGCGGEGPLVGTPPKARPGGTGGGTASGPAFAPIPIPAPPVVTTPEPGKGPPYPVVLVHGMGGFDTLQGLGVTYFNGVKADLLAHGVTDVFVTRTSPYDTSEVRAKELLTQIDQILVKTGAAKVNIIAHSQGGMDARILASPGGLADGARIASITMIGTPNRGTPVANLVMKALNAPVGGVIDNVTETVLSLLEQTLYDVRTKPALRAQIEELTTAHMVKVFNVAYPDDPRVAYMSYAGRTNFEAGVTACAGSFYPNQPGRLDAAQVPLFPTAVYMQGFTDIANDGMVPVSSARWGTFMRCLPADHGREIGQINLTGPDPLTGFDHLKFYRTLVSRLRAMGF